MTLSPKSCCCKTSASIHYSDTVRQSGSLYLRSHKLTCCLPYVHKGIVPWDHSLYTVTPGWALLWFEKGGNGIFPTSKTHQPSGLPVPNWDRTEGTLFWNTFFHRWALIFLRISVWWKSGGKSECVCYRELENPIPLTGQKAKSFAAQLPQSRVWREPSLCQKWNDFPLKHSLPSTEDENILLCEKFQVKKLEKKQKKWNQMKGGFW